MSKAAQFVEFLSKCYSPYHVIQSVAEQLERKGFKRLCDVDHWEGVLAPQSRYYYTKNQSSLVAFAVGKEYEVGNGLTISGSHSDCPSLKVKANPVIEGKGIQSVGMELYGGGTWHTWFDRDLGLGGKVMVQTSHGIESRLLAIDEPLLHIPGLAIHMNREQNKSFSFDRERHMSPVFSLTSESKKSGSMNDELFALLAERLGVDPSQILDFELTAFDQQKAVLGGMHKEFVYSQGLDNRSMTFIDVVGFLESLEDNLEHEKNIRYPSEFSFPHSVLTIFDFEEVGSLATSGANGQILNDFFARNFDSRLIPQIKARSLCVSADAGHGAHPKYSEYVEENHPCLMGEGCLIKASAGQSYATNSISRSILKSIAKSHGVPLQDFIIRQNLVSGTTIGPIVAGSTGILTIDIGIPLLSMHSIREMATVRDVESSCALMKHFYQDFSSVL